jgi:flagellar basal-body rod protein FlgC
MARARQSDFHMDVGSISNDVFGIARSGITTAIAQLDVAANNLANSQTNRRTSETAFRPQQVVTTSLPGGGVAIAGLMQGGSDQGVVFADPVSALADAKGNVRGPEVDMATEMVQLMIAKFGVESNSAVLRSGADAYQSIMDLMKPGANGALLG